MLTKEKKTSNAVGGLTGGHRLWVNWLKIKCEEKKNASDEKEPELKKANRDKQKNKIGRKKIKSEK